jgi:hypothetical protein
VTENFEIEWPYKVFVYEMPIAEMMTNIMSPISVL